MRIFVISDNTDTVTGLRLVGISGVVVHTREEFEKAFSGVLRDREIGIVLIVEKLAKQFDAEIKEIKLSNSIPLLVEIPDRHGSGRSENFITEYIQQAIGVKLQ